MKKRVWCNKKNTEPCHGISHGAYRADCSGFCGWQTKNLYLNAGGSSLWDQAGAWFDAWI